MMAMLKKCLRNSPIFAFNQLSRDRWVAAQAATLPEGSRVLDVGAGSCPYRPLFSHCEYRTQDFTGLQADQLRYSGYGEIDYVCDATAIPVPDSSFDVILCTEVLEHLAEPLEAMREFSRILKPGGKLILTAPLGSGLHQEPHHYYGGFTPYWYKRFLAAYGFAKIEVEANGGSFRFFSQESLRFARETRPLKLGMPLVAELAWLPFWAFIFPMLALVIPLWSGMLDRFDRERRFTVGYHVTAERQQ